MYRQWSQFGMQCPQASQGQKDLRSSRGSAVRIHSWDRIQKWREDHSRWKENRGLEHSGTDQPAQLETGIVHDLQSTCIFLCTSGLRFLLPTHLGCPVPIGGMTKMALPTMIPLRCRPRLSQILLLFLHFHQEKKKCQVLGSKKDDYSIPVTL